MKHLVTIKVAKPGEAPETVLSSGSRRIRTRLAKLLFGDFSNVFVMSPGRSVSVVEIREIKEDPDNVQ